MPEYYGALPLPTVAPAVNEAAGDPALRYIVEYLQAVLNVECAAAVQAVWRDVDTVRTIFAHDPSEVVFNERDMPALFLYRENAPSIFWEGHDWRIARDQLTLLWVMPPGTQANRRARMPLVNAIVKAVDKAIESYRHPAWVVTGDTDITAASIAALPTAIKTSVATSTLAQSYSGAALNGVIGAGTIAPARGITVTCSGADANFVDGSVITVHGLDLFGLANQRTITITHAGIPGTFSTGYAFTAVTSFDIPAQAGTGGTFTFGVGAYQGRGSELFKYAPHGLKIENAKFDSLTVDVKFAGKVEPRDCDCVVLTLSMEEKREYDLDAYDINGGTDIDIAQGDGSFVVQVQLDGA